MLGNDAKTGRPTMFGIGLFVKGKGGFQKKIVLNLNLIEKKTDL